MEANKVDSAAPRVGWPTVVRYRTLRYQMGLRKNPEAGATLPNPPNFESPPPPGSSAMRDTPLTLAGCPQLLASPSGGFPALMLVGLP